VLKPITKTPLKRNNSRSLIERKRLKAGMSYSIIFDSLPPRMRSLFLFNGLNAQLRVATDLRAGSLPKSPIYEICAGERLQDRIKQRGAKQIQGRQSLKSGYSNSLVYELERLGFHACCTYTATNSISTCCDPPFGAKPCSRALRKSRKEQGT